MKKKMLIAVILAGIILTVGCTSVEQPVQFIPSAVPPVSVTDKGAETTPAVTETPEEPSPTEAPAPTPIVDRPAERYDADINPRSSENEIPIVLSVDSVPKKLNPIFYSDTDREYLDLTQLKLFGTDSDGNATAGVASDGLAYSVLKLDKSAGFGELTEIPDNYDAYRIVLKDGVCFADGEPVTVDDVLFTIYALSDRSYKGASKISKQPIFGMMEYSTQVPTELRAQAEKALAGGINPDGTMPVSCHMQSSKWHEVWDYYNTAGINMTRDIVNYVNKNYGFDPYVNAFLSTNLTYAHVAASESLKVAYAMAFWGFIKSYRSSTNVLKDFYGVEHKLNEEELTVEDFWDIINRYHGYDLDEMTGVNYEIAPNCKMTFEDYIAEAFFDDRRGVESITGIVASSQEYKDGAVRDCIDILLENGADIGAFNFYIAEKSFYESRPHSDRLHGAGRYVLTDVYTGHKDDEFETEFTRLEFTANNSYILGSPETHYIIYTTETEIPVEEEIAEEEPVNEEVQQ